MSEQAAMKNEHRAYLQVNGLNMYYESYGDGIPVILLHGGLTTSNVWSP
jgi:pimeloyl-ACP methyl ester carboxylesterase